MMRRTIAVTALLVGILAAPVNAAAPAAAASPACGEARLFDFGNRLSTLLPVEKVRHEYRIREDGIHGPQTLKHILWRGSFPGATGPVPTCARF